MKNENNYVIKSIDGVLYYKYDYTDFLYQKSEDFKSKIDKAIEYINIHKVSDTISFPLMKKDEEQQIKSCFDYEFNQIYKKELLKILKGDDKNEK